MNSAAVAAAAGGLGGAQAALLGPTDLQVVYRYLPGCVCKSRLY